MSGTTGVRRRRPDGGNDVTTSGSVRLFSAWSIAATRARGARMSMGVEKTRRASPLQTGHGVRAGCAPSGRISSNAPCRSQRYS